MPLSAQSLMYVSVMLLRGRQGLFYIADGRLRLCDISVCPVALPVFAEFPRDGQGFRDSPGCALARRTTKLIQ